MRQVGCDFCGDTTAGTFEVLPPDRDPDGDGRRMVLCDGCRDTLASVLDPLLDAPAGDVEPSVDDPTTGSRPATEPDARPVTAAPEAGGDASDADAADPTDEQRAESEMASTGAGTSSRVPKGYRKVLRFLENRAFPLDRGEAVGMAANAYGLEPEAVEAALDHADAHDRLTVSQGEIRVP